MSTNETFPNFIFCSVVSLTSVLSYYFCNRFVSNNYQLFKAAGLQGKDYGRPEAPPIAEAVGVVGSAVYLCVLSINIMVPYLICIYFLGINIYEHISLVAILAGSWSICSMCLLGFTDDVLNLRWKHKLVLPVISSFPLIVVYCIQKASTYVLIPFPFKYLLGTSVDLGVFYLVYVCCLALFCTNSINILAGINGLEVGQSIIIAISMIIMSLVELYLGNKDAIIILFFLIPFTAVSLSLLKFNWFPASIFVGDTYCYYSGMTLAVSGILGHSSRTLLLFFIPQILNFVYSTPQLFKLFPCPRHRLPSLNPETNLREVSTFVVRVNTLNIATCVILGLMARFGFAKITRKGLHTTHSAEVDNLTLLNFYLRLYGPFSEAELAKMILKFQILCCLVGLFAKYTLGKLIF
ncbi:UDP-N-acetylglucosamine--dolichyl-phosphate N-acetylglucosaminephosphotransferase [Thelohanellus kitauei]|uniref:UDP-N-acetylglucosamine--dolichyl-phosphate N-acetylglucosaminephosphotransferase n=1 Tax=Thelohanellus kitauei TaxID=669202 RepID=A0A0C2IBN4_THEKT|nr:UDP-N-acetylglucosamine--dolichyl-phosphate N-acetylglucosaminephosphotransferase [Thelohanellus kitauei]